MTSSIRLLVAFGALDWVLSREEGMAVGAVERVLVQEEGTAAGAVVWMTLAGMGMIWATF